MNCWIHRNQINNNAMDNKELIKELNDIIVRNNDASKGFRTAADNVKSKDLKTIFEDCSTQRNTFADEIQGIVRSLGGEPKDHTSTESKLHRTWMDLKSSLSSDNDESILEACITGEKAAVKEYDKFLDKSGISTDIRSRIDAQRSMVKRTLEEVRELEHITD